ncbi:predicted protein [Naegleria gruberi]|uniref:Predicted protein n=1 Tax=Naegleria gruberi TaxID=5762 RepID=D2VD37_NAEGR|nr:uncharacterized protein NAEGRDRAFT_48644 [Naegleria gruberi]EFC45167.1 predicted protein [Naegleria gruberi]|eukprot:XP_002677911.1 predicted protein [Naegleria gruberi strain NEG-M]
MNKSQPQEFIHQNSNKEFKDDNDEKVKTIKTQVGVDNIAISKSSEYSLFDWFNYWFRGITLSVSTFGAVSNPHKYIEKQGDLLPDRLSHDFYSRIYRFNKEEYVDAIVNAKDDVHAPLTHNYEDCMQARRGMTIFGVVSGGIFGSAFAYAKNFGTITNRKRYLPYTLSGVLIGFTMFRFVIAPRTESCFEQIINQALSERIITKGYNNMMEYYKQNEKPKMVNWSDYELDKEQQDYLNTKMREHMLNAMKKAGCNKESIESFTDGNELVWKQHLDVNFKRKYPSHRKYFEFL